MGSEIVTAATTTETIFWACAIGGTLFFFLRVALMIVGHFGDDISGDVYHDTDTPGGTDYAFKLLSLNSVSGFIMIFGWMGLAGSRQLGLGSFFSTVIAFIAGLIFMVLTAYLFKMAMKMASSGTVFNLNTLAGRHATVYQTIPVDGMGKVQLTVDGILRELKAVSETKQEIASFTHVEIVKILDGQFVSVRPVA